jgi:translation initiation factor 3 subunit E
MAEWDLSQKIIPYLDRHLAFPLLAYLTETGLFPAEEVQTAQYELARKTNMVDFAVNLFEAVYPGQEIPGGELDPPARDPDLPTLITAFGRF